MGEYAVFNDEGCLERGFPRSGAAEAALLHDYPDERHGYVAMLCPDHDEQIAGFCQSCDGEDQT